MAYDVIDILNGIVIALPIPIIDTVGVTIINMLEGAIAGGAASLISSKFEELSQSYPRLAQVLRVLSYPLGGNVILKAFNNIDALSPENIQLTLQSRSTMSGEIINITPRQNSLTYNNPEDTLALPPPSLDDILSESLKMNRICLLAGV